MKEPKRKWLTAFLFTLFFLSCLSMPSIVMSGDDSTTPAPTEPQPDEEPECD